MRNLKSTLFRTVLIVLGLASVLQAQPSTGETAPQFCPVWEPFLTPTLVDILLFPGSTFR